MANSPALRSGLRGRRSECRSLNRLLAGVRSGHSEVLVLRGEAGVGKTALLEYLIEAAADLRVVRATGVESEMELAYAGLHQLCAPMLEQRDRLPAPQRDALQIVFGLSEGPAPDRFLVALAVLSLLSEVAEERPLLCVVDDAQWLDRASAQVLGFVARRLFAEPVGLVFAAREPGAEFRGLRELDVQGLRDSDARELLRSVVRGPLDERIREQIIAETRGNPLALLELPRGRSPAELAGGLGLLGAGTLSGRIEGSFVRRLDALPDETRLLMVIAAAEPVGDSALLWRAATQLGLTGEAAAPAASVGLLEIGDRVRFHHPLVRSAVYRAASLPERQRVHGALADATDPGSDADRRAWHRSQATPGTDEDVAVELERSADRAQARGGIAAAAAFLEKAAGLTPDPARRAPRSLAAAQAKHLAGASDAALTLLAVARAGPLDELGCARVDLLRAQIAYSQSRGRDAPPLLLQAAKRLEPVDPGLARETYLDALWAAQFAGRLGSGGGAVEVAQAALAAPIPSGSSRACDLLLEGLARQFIDGYAAGVPMLKQAVSAFRRQEVSVEEELRWLWLAGHAAVVLWDDESWTELAARHMELGRAAGALAVLPIALSSRICAHTFAGELLAASQLIDEMRTVTDAIGGQLPPYGPLLVAAWRGREAQASGLIDEALRDATERGEGQGVAAAQYSRALLYNGLGRYEEAMTAATLASEHRDAAAFSNMALVELTLVAARTGETKRAADALARVSEMARASGSDWARGVEARSRAMMGEGNVAEHLYREAIERLGRTRLRAELARAHLLYGEWLRRENRRVDARAQLHTAHALLTEIGMEAFAERARIELAATGEKVRKRTVETRDELTAQELQIARMALDGLSNPEIGTRLFISPRTVKYHLRKVFTKLEITSRQELKMALPDAVGRTALA